MLKMTDDSGSFGVLWNPALYDSVECVVAELIRYEPFDPSGHYSVDDMKLQA